MARDVSVRCGPTAPTLWRGGGLSTGALPATVREIGSLYLEQIDVLSGRVDELGKRLRSEAGQAAATRRLQTMPGVGPMLPAGQGRPPSPWLSGPR